VCARGSAGCGHPSRGAPWGTTGAGKVDPAQVSFVLFFQLQLKSTGLDLEPNQIDNLWILIMILISHGRPGAFWGVNQQNRTKKHPARDRSPPFLRIPCVQLGQVQGWWGPGRAACMHRNSNVEAHVGACLCMPEHAQPNGQGCGGTGKTAAACPGNPLAFFALRIPENLADLAPVLFSITLQVQLGLFCRMGGVVVSPVMGVLLAMIDIIMACK